MTLPGRAGEAARPASAARAFEFLNAWADRILVISLPRASDRRARIALRLGGLDFRLRDGVDRLELDRDQLVRDGLFDEGRTPASYRHRHEMTLGEIGAALAHRSVYADAVANGWRRVVVFEDDVLPRIADLALLAETLGQLPADFDLCYLGHGGREDPTPWQRVKQACYVGFGPLGVLPWTRSEALRLHARPFSPNLRRAGLHMGAYAYAISLAGAQKLLDAQTPVALRADWLFPYLILRGGIDAFVTRPRFFDHEGPDDLPTGAPSTYLRG